MSQNDQCESVCLAVMARADKETSQHTAEFSLDEVRLHLQDCASCRAVAAEFGFIESAFDGVERSKIDVEIWSQLSAEILVREETDVTKQTAFAKETSMSTQNVFRKSRVLSVTAIVCLVAIALVARNILLNPLGPPPIPSPNPIVHSSTPLESASSPKPDTIPYGPAKQVDPAEFQKQYGKYFADEYQQLQKTKLRDRNDEDHWRIAGIATQKETLGYLFIDDKGLVTLATKYPLVDKFSEGLALVGTTVNDQSQIGDYGYIDKTGDLKIPGDFKSGDRFNEGLAAVMKNGKVGFIDRSGKTVIDFKYRSAEGFQNGIARCRRDVDNVQFDIEFIDKTGKVLFIGRDSDIGRFSEGLLYVNLTPGRAKIPEEIKIDRTVDQAVPNGRDVGYLNAQFEFEIKIATDMEDDRYFLQGEGFHEGLAEVAIGHKTGEQKGFINRQGELVVEKPFLETQPFSNGLAAVNVRINPDDKSNPKYRWGFVDPKGNMVIEPQYFWTSGFSEGKAAVIVEVESKPNETPGAKWAFIDKTGKVVFESSFYQASFFQNGLARVQENPFSHGYIDHTGKYIWRMDQPTYGFDR